MIYFDRTKAQAPIINKNYKTEQIYDALEIVFGNKCYLCETWQPDPRNFDIEHFKAHGNDPFLKYLWINLYLACGGTCNQYKSDAEILDPCNPDENVETLIIYEYTSTAQKIILRFHPKDPNNQKVVNTCNLLDKIHNGSNPKSVRKTAALRLAIRNRAEQLYKAIIKYYKEGKDGNEFEEAIALRKIKRICSRYSPYTMLMRAVATDEMKPKDLQNLFD